MLSARPAAAQEALPHARAGRIAGTVALDGRLDEPFWKDAPAHSGFRALTPKRGQPAPPEESTFRIACDAGSLLLGIVCREPQVANLIARATNRDGAVWSDDSVEVLLQPGDLFYYQFAVNSVGAVYDARLPVQPKIGAAEKSNGSLWDGVWESAVHRGEGEWSIEMRLPFAALELGPDTRPAWRLNVGRTAARRVEYSAWAPVEKGFHDLPLFGYLDGVAPNSGAFPLDARALEFPPLFVGTNRLALSVPARRGGSFRVATSLREWAPGPLPTRRALAAPAGAVAGRLPLALDVSVTRPGILHELVVEVADAETGAPVLLRAHLFRAPEPFAASLEWMVYYTSDRQATAAVTLAVAPGSARGNLSATLLREGSRVGTPARRPANRSGEFRLPVSFAGLPDGAYSLEVAADLPDVGRFRKSLRFFKVAGPFERQ